MTGLRRLLDGLRPASPDAELVRAFATDRDEAAFTQLVRRHGPLVYGVCRRVFPPAADDAFQATFLLLALKAGKLRDPAAVAGWLHGVAVRTSREAKAMAARRRLKERLAAKPEVTPEPSDAETLARLDAAVQGLPARYRAAVLLCDLAEKTRAEAAAELGVPEGTVASRLARGRKLLAAKLGGHLPVVAAVAVPPALMSNTVQAGVLLAAGGAVPPAVSLLVIGVTRAMSGSVLKPVLAAGLVAVGVGGAWGWQAAPKPADPPPAAAKAETLAKQWKKLKAEYDAEKKANTKPKLDPSGKPIPNQSTTIQPRPEKYAGRLATLGRCDDPDVAVAALTLTVVGWSQLPAADDALDQLLVRFGGDPRLADFVKAHRQVGYIGKERRLQRVLGVATDPTARAYATIDLAHEYDSQESDVPTRAAAVALYRKVMTEHAAVEDGRLARWAENTLRNAEKMRAGRPASPLAGVAADGQPMDLTDFKGRVVVLAVATPENTSWDYTTAWLKEVHTRYAGKPVTVVGLVSIRQDDQAEATAAAAKMPWRSWRDVRDPKTNEGPALTAWGILTVPSLIVIDQAGVIRHPDLRTREQVEAAVDALLAAK